MPQLRKTGISSATPGKRACPDSLSLSLYLSLVLSLSISEECLPLCQHIHIKTGLGVGLEGPGLVVVWVQEIKDMFVNHNLAGGTACENVIV